MLESLKGLYLQEKYYNYFDYDYKRLYVENGTDRVVSSRISRDMGTPLFDWPHVWKSIHRPINGQVKNFLIACAAAYHVQTKDVIVVRGSKQAQGGGIWHTMFASYVAAKADNVIINFYDPGELRDCETWKIGPTEMQLNWIDGFYEGDGSEVAIVIDDAWIGGKVVGMEPKSRNYVVKGNPGQKDGFFQFLHVSETRKFSHYPPKGPVYCPCAVCRVCSDVTWDYGSYQWIRGMCVALGFDPCTYQAQQTQEDYDYIKRNLVLRDLNTKPVVILRTQAEIRAAMSLPEDNRVKILGPTSMALSPNAKRTHLVHTHTTLLGDAPCESEVISKLVGKKVAFMGVEPSVLGTTQINAALDMTKMSEVDAIVCGSIMAAMAAPRAKFLYVNAKSSELDRIINYKQTGFRFRNFSELVYQNGRDAKMVANSGLFRKMVEDPLFEGWANSEKNGGKYICGVRYDGEKWVMKQGYAEKMILRSKEGFSFYTGSPGAWVWAGVVGIPDEYCDCGAPSLGGKCLVQCTPKMYWSLKERRLTLRKDVHHIFLGLKDMSYDVRISVPGDSYEITLPRYASFKTQSLFFAFLQAYGNYSELKLYEDGPFRNSLWLVKKTND